MHTQPMSESDGTFDEPKKTDRECRKCGVHAVTYETWDSSDGGYTDYKYTCGACGHTWWIDGIDS